MIALPQSTRNIHLYFHVIGQKSSFYKGPKKVKKSKKGKKRLAFQLRLHESPSYKSAKFLVLAVFLASQNTQYQPFKMAEKFMSVNSCKDVFLITYLDLSSILLDI